MPLNRIIKKKYVHFLTVGDEIVGCSGIFADTQLIYSPVFFMFMIFKFCLPIWSLLAVLEPLPTGISYSEILATSHSGVSIYKIRFELQLKEK